MQKHKLEKDQEGMNLLHDTERWLNETNKSLGDLHISATLPSLARLIEKITDPEVSEAFQGLLCEMEELRTDNANLNDAVVALQGEVTTLHTFPRLLIQKQ